MKHRPQEKARLKLGGLAKVRSKPIRTCIVCRTKSPNDNLIRFGFGRDAELIVIARTPTHGRTAYVCNSKTCIEQIGARNSLDRALKTTLKQDLKDTLREEILCKLR